MKKLLLTIAVFALSLAGGLAQLNLTTTNYTQNFDSLGSSGTATLPTGWFVTNSTSAFTGTNATTLAYGTVGTGAVTGTSGGGYINWANGTNATSTDRALGILNTGSFTSPRVIILSFTNSLAATITNLSLAWDYEKYRSGTRQWDWSFAYSTDGSTWTTNASGAQTYAADANNTTVFNPPTSTNKSFNISGLSLLNNAVGYLKWTLTGSGGSSNGQGLAVDNFSLTALTQAIVGVLDWIGGSGNWSTGFSGAITNGSSVAFSGPGGTASNDLSSPILGSMTFSNSAGSYTIDGNAFAISNGIVNNSANAQVFSNAITLGAAQTFNAASGAMTFAGNIDNAGNGLTIAGASNTVVSGIISGAAGLTKVGSGTLSLEGVNSFVGNIDLQGGVLQISADSALGNVANDLANNGTLKTTATIALDAGRDISGSGTYDIANGTTLTVNGNVNNTSTTLANTGTLDLQGGTRTLGSLTLNAAGTISGSGAISVTGLTAPGVGSGTATVNPGIVFTTSGDKTLNVAAGGTVDLNGSLTNSASTTSRIAKTGAGTLILSAANNMGGVRIGAAGAAPTEGGTVILENSAIGTQAQAIQLNYGTLSAASNLTFTNGLSIGGRSGAVAVLSGSSMEFQGSSSFFRANGTSGELLLDINNTTTFSGGFGATTSSGTGSSTGVTFGGTGTLVIGGDGSAFTDALTFGSSLTAVRVTSSNALASAIIVGGADKLQIATTNMTVAGISGAQNISLETVDPTPQAVALTINTAVASTNTGIISGSGSLTKTGAGSLVLGGANSYTGPTSILDGRLILSLNGSLTSDVTVGSLGSIGGLGTIAGDLFLASGADFVFDLNGPLIVDSGTVSFGGLSIADIVGLTSATAEGVYTLIDGTATFDFSNVSNFGSNNAVSLGDGKFAYFSEGSLQVNVVPEPSTYALLALAGAGFAGYVIRRRRR